MPMSFVNVFEIIPNNFTHCEIASYVTTNVSKTSFGSIRYRSSYLIKRVYHTFHQTKVIHYVKKKPKWFIKRYT